MQPLNHHTPGKPSSPEPPQKLLDIVDQFQPPKQVFRWGITCTKGGAWALLASVAPATPVPIEAVENAADGYPVIYVDEPSQPIRAL